MLWPQLSSAPGEHFDGLEDRMRTSYISFSSIPRAVSSARIDTWAWGKNDRDSHLMRGKANADERSRRSVFWGLTAAIEPRLWTRGWISSGLRLGLNRFRAKARIGLIQGLNYTDLIKIWSKHCPGNVVSYPVTVAFNLILSTGSDSVGAQWRLNKGIRWSDNRGTTWKDVKTHGSASTKERCFRQVLLGT